MFLNFVHPNLPGVFNELSVNGSLWTIKVELVFYLCLPIIIHVLTKIDNTINRSEQKFSVLILYVFSVILAYGISYLVKRFSLSESLLNQFPSLLCYFFAGMLCFYYLEFIQKHVVVLTLISIFFIVLNIFINVSFLLLISLAIVVVFLVFHLKPFNNINKNIDFSYGMYLWYYPVVMCLNQTNIFTLYPILAIIIIIAISFFATYLFENYIQQVINNRVQILK